jgi:Putative peptidoglycan binding domain
VAAVTAMLFAVCSIAFADADQTTTKAKTGSSQPSTKTAAPHKSTKSDHAKSQVASASAPSHKGKKSKKTSRRGQQKIDSDRTHQIQQALIQQHYLSGEPTGKWDTATEDALRKFQGDNGWQNKTVPDSRALIKLGLGPSHDHLLNPESAMTTAPDSPRSATHSSSAPASTSAPAPTRPQQP